MRVSTSKGETRLAVDQSWARLDDTLIRACSTARYRSAAAVELGFTDKTDRMAGTASRFRRRVCWGAAVSNVVDGPLTGEEISLSDDGEGIECVS